VKDITKTDIPTESGYYWATSANRHGSRRTWMKHEEAVRQIVKVQIFHKQEASDCYSVDSFETLTPQSLRVTDFVDWEGPIGKMKYLGHPPLDPR
jgi:hypothetical protein